MGSEESGSKSTLTNEEGTSFFRATKGNQNARWSFIKQIVEYSRKQGQWRKQI